MVCLSLVVARARSRAASTRADKCYHLRPLAITSSSLALCSALSMLFA